MSGGARVVALGASLWLLSGCLFFDPFGSRLKRLGDQVESLDGRVGQIEVQRGVAPPVEAMDVPEPEAFAPSRAGSQALAAAPRRLPSLPLDGRKAMMKLGRGAINLITGWVEIPRRMDETSKRSGLGTGLTWGLLRGMGHGFVRTAGGAYEVVTFPFPAPPDYQPIMRPEYVFTQAEEMQAAHASAAPPPGQANP